MATTLNEIGVNGPVGHCVLKISSFQFVCCFKSGAFGSNFSIIVAIIIINFTIRMNFDHSFNIFGLVMKLVSIIKRVNEFD